MAKLPTVPGNYLTEPHNRSFDLLFNHFRCEYTLWSVNESLCCSTSVPYLDITVLIRWIKLISKSEHRRRCFSECRGHHSVYLMICLPVCFPFRAALLFLCHFSSTLSVDPRFNASITVLLHIG